MKDKILTTIIISFLIVISILFYYQKHRAQKTIKALNAINSSQIVLFRIYPRVAVPDENFIELKASESIIDDFFRSLGDIRSYKPSHDTIISENHSWFLEMELEKGRIQINFYIPSQQRDIVVGVIRKFNDAKTRAYFQSRQLYHWYQKYSHCWLEPEEAPTPSP